MKIRTLIVDDEPLARERLRDLLADETDIEVVGECASGSEAVAKVKELKPDLIFLDIQMPELDGFGVLNALRSGSLPVVVFVTAFDRFALRAFEVHALDYLLKPFDRERFQTTLARAREHIEKNQRQELSVKVSALLDELGSAKSDPKRLDRLTIKSEGRLLFLKLEDIDWVEAADNYVHLHVGTESHLLRETMTALESRLPADKFLRISRSNIVNVDRIKELHPMFHGEYVVVLRGGTKLTLSRNYRERVQRFLGKIS